MKNINPKLNWIFPIINLLVFIGVMSLFYMQVVHKDKIVYVDSGKLLSEFSEAKDARKAFEAKASTWKMNIDTLGQEVQVAIKDYEKRLSHMSKEEQSSKREFINAKRKELVDYQRAIEEKARKENSKLMGEVVSKLNKFLLEYGKDHNYKMILIANQSGTIAYAQDGLDITSEVVEALNKQLPGK